jgi:Domain of unknown function (DUF1707)
MTMEHQPERAALRASDQDRDAAAGLVQEAHGDGRLDITELDERLTQVYASKTKQELEAITADLVPAAHGGIADVLTLRAKGSTVKRDGPWQVPPRIVAESQHASVRLDFTRAVIRHCEILVEVSSKHGSIQMIVPQGWSVNVDEVYSEWGSVQNKAGAPLPGLPALRVTGQTKHGSVVVRHPRRRRWWWPFGRRR